MRWVRRDLSTQTHTYIPTSQRSMHTHTHLHTYIAEIYRTMHKYIHVKASPRAVCITLNPKPQTPNPKPQTPHTCQGLTARGVRRVPGTGSPSHEWWDERDDGKRLRAGTLAPGLPVVAFAAPVRHAAQRRNEHPGWKRVRQLRVCHH